MTQVMEAVKTTEKTATPATDRVVGQIFVTTNYSQFKTIKGNRMINQAHKVRLKRSMKEDYLISPICVNEKMEIIDGTHREEAAEELGLPVYYYVLPGYGWEEVHRMNTNMKNWGKAEYLKAYCDMRYPEYLKFQTFMKDYPDFSFAPAEAILTEFLGTNRTSNAKELISSTNKRGSYKLKYFEEGVLKIPDLKKSYDNAEKIMMIKPYFEFFSEALFVRTMLGLFKNPNYNHSMFINKLSMQPTMLQKQRNVEAYRLHIEDIYNYRNRNKVSLRY